MIFEQNFPMEDRICSLLDTETMVPKSRRSIVHDFSE